MISSSHQKSRAGFAAIAAGSFLFLVLYDYAWRWVLPASAQGMLFSDLVAVLVNLFSVAALGFAAWRTYLHTPRAAYAWAFLAASQFLYVVGDVIWLVLNSFLGVEPFPSIADAFYLAYYPLFLIGVILLPDVHRSLLERITISIDSSIVLLSAMLFFWVYLFSPLVQLSSETDLLTLMISFAYPAFDLLLLWALLVLVYRRSETIQDAVFLSLSAGILAMIAADMFFTASVYQPLPDYERWSQVLWLASYLLIGMAAVHHGLFSSHPAKTAPDAVPLAHKSYPSLRSYLPYVWVVALYALLVVQLSERASWDRLASLLWVGLVLGMVIVRQLISIREIASLSEGLSQARDQLEAHVLQRTRQLESTNQALQQQFLERQRTESALQLSEESYRNVVEDLPVLICRFLPNGTLTFVNEAYCRYFNKTREELIGHSFSALIPEEDQEIVSSTFGKLGPANPVVTYEHRVISPSGEIRWQRWTDRAVLDGEQVVEYQSIGEDITDSRLAEQALRRSEEQFRDLFDNSSDLIQFVDPLGSFIFVNRAWKQSLGYTELQLKALNLWDILPESHMERFRELYERAMLGESIKDVEMVLIDCYGNWIPVEGNLNALTRDGRVLMTRGIFRDVSERKKAQQQLEHQAFYDALTGLPNRLYFSNHLRRMLSSAQQDPESPFAILFLDVDNFKVVNDSLGHPAGDYLLVMLAERLKLCLRDEDVTARLGGDEFVIALKGVDREEAASIAERILREVRRPFEYQEHRIVASVSIGLVYYQPVNGPLKYETVEDILRDADIAMYRAKALGKDCIVSFEINLRDEAMQRLLLENELRRAIEAQEFCLQYQPIYNLKTRHLVGFEALIRWKHPRKGMVYPVDFIYLAEETGLIVPIGEWVLQEACHQVQSWRSQSPHLEHLMVSVNISGRQLVSPYLGDLVRATLQASGLPPNNLALEISENAVMENLQNSAEILTTLSTLGIRFHVDDFGTGYSSLGRLQALPIDAIKIDRTFISQMKPDGAGGEIVRAVVNMCKELNINIISEGIELTHQLEGLLDLECSLGQGYLLSLPVNAHAAQELLGLPVPISQAPG